MPILIIVEEPDDWPLEIPNVTIVSARTYLTDPGFAVNHGARQTHSLNRSTRVFNLCKSYHYQSSSYYVSLLAEARGHKPMPKVGPIQDLQSQNLVRHLTEDLSVLIQRLLAPLAMDHFELSIYFGCTADSRYSKLCRQLFNLLQVPLLSARFERHHNQWSLRSVRAIDASDLSGSQREFAVLSATEYFKVKSPRRSKRHISRFDLAILHDPDNPEPPSNAKALQMFKSAAEELSMRVKFITRADIGLLPQFDALFIRDTTFVNHYTYYFSRLASAERLVAIDDPESILKCNNKVYLAELLARHNIQAPKTLLVHSDNIARIIPELGLPCILKQPDSSFSRGVVKIETEVELLPQITELLTKSVLVIAQEWLPTEFDWRIGILDRKPLFVAKYYFPPGHWQVIKRDAQKRKMSEGSTRAIPLGEAPQEIVGIALKSANLIGDGFYGVDIKQSGNCCYVIEVNDNPNVDAGNEDAVLKDALYREVMGVFLKRIEARKRGNEAPAAKPDENFYGFPGADRVPST